MLKRLWNESFIFHYCWLGNDKDAQYHLKAYEINYFLMTTIF